MGSAYGFGGIGKIIAPASLALIIGSSNTINSKVALDSDHPRLFYFATWFAIVGVIYLALALRPKVARSRRSMRSLWGPRRRDIARSLGTQVDPLAPAIATALSLSVPISGTARGDRGGRVRRVGLRPAAH